MKSKITAIVIIAIGAVLLLVGATYHRFTVLPGCPISHEEIDRRIEALEDRHKNDYGATAAERSLSEWRAKMNIQHLRAGRVRTGIVTLEQDDLYFLGGLLSLLGTVILVIQRLAKK